MQEIGTGDILKWDTVGRIGPTSLSCGDVRTVFEDCSTVQGHDRTAIKLGCNSYGCTVCHYRRVAREAKKAYSRLSGLGVECYRRGLDLGDLRHVVLSPPPEQRELFLTRSGYQKLNKKALRYYQDVGVIGGALCWHMVRGSPREIKAYKQHQLNLELSPHTHTVGYMPEGHKINSDAFYEATGWIYKNIPIVTSGGALNVLAYELSHAAIYPTATGSSHVLRWWGATSYNRISVQVETTRIPKTCQECSAEKHRYHEDYDQDLGVAHDIKEKRSYDLNTKQFGAIVQKFTTPPALRPRPGKITEYAGVTT